MKQNTKIMIKAKTQNAIHSIIDPNPKKPRHSWQVRANDRNTELNALTPGEKLTMFNAIIEADRKGSIELTHYLFERREKKRIQKLRDAAIAAGTRKVKVKQTKAEAERYKAKHAA